MAITFVNKSAFASGTAALTVGAVASVVADDLILLFVESANENIATPTGYTQVTNSPVSTGTAATAGGVRLAVFYSWATGADTTTSVADSGNHTTAIKIAYRGVDLTTPFDATPVTGIKTPASTSTSFPGITTTTANAKIVHASGLDLDAASTATTGAATNANLTSITELHDQTISGGVGGGLVIIDGTKATAGATGNTTATVTSTIQVYLTMALREKPVTQTLTPTLYTNSNTLHAPTVTVGAVTLSAVRYDNEPVFYAATVSSAGGVQDLTPLLYTNTQSFFAPTVTPMAVSLTPALYSNAQSFFAPAVGRGTVTLNATRYDNGQVFYAPTVSVGAATLTPARFDNTQTFYAAVVSSGAALLAPDRLDNTQAFYAATVTPGAIALTPARLDNTSTFYAPSVSSGVPQFITFPDWVDPGWVEPGWVEWPYFNQHQFFGSVVFNAGLPPAPPITPSEIDPIGGAFNIPTRQQMRDMVQKQRIALGILPKPVQKKAKAAAKRIARIALDGGTAAQVQAALEVIPPAQRVDAMSAVQVSYAYYLAVQTQAQKEIARIQAQEQEIAEILAEIERTSIIQREEDDIAFLLMQVIMAE